MSRPDYVFAVQEGKLVRFAVESFNEETGGFVACRGRSRVRAHLEDSEFFETVEQAVSAHHEGYKQGVQGAFNEIQDAVAAYRTIRKIANMSLEEFMVLLPLWE